MIKRNSLEGGQLLSYGSFYCVLFFEQRVLKHSIISPFTRYIVESEKGWHGMEFNKKWIVLCLVSTVLTVYTITVHGLAERHLYKDPVSTIVYWTSGPSGSLFPWPKAPGLLEIITQTNVVDLFIYQYLVKTQALIGLSFFLWVITGVYIFRRDKSARPLRYIEESVGE